MKNMATELGIILIGYFTLVPAIQVSVAGGLEFVGQRLSGTAGTQRTIFRSPLWLESLVVGSMCRCGTWGHGWAGMGVLGGWTWWSQRSFPTLMILWVYDLVILYTSVQRGSLQELAFCPAAASGSPVSPVGILPVTGLTHWVHPVVCPGSLPSPVALHTHKQAGLSAAPQPSGRWSGAPDPAGSQLLWLSGSGTRTWLPSLSPWLDSHEWSRPDTQTLTCSGCWWRGHMGSCAPWSLFWLLVLRPCLLLLLVPRTRS